MNTPIFAYIRKANGDDHLVNLCSIIEMVPDFNAGTTAIYSTGNCLWNGHAFDVAPSEITGAIANPEYDGNGIVDLRPPEGEEEEEEEADA